MKRKTILAAILLASSMFFSVPPSARAQGGNCIDGVICPVPWDAYNCAPMGILVDCSVCTITPQMP